LQDEQKNLVNEPKTAKEVLKNLNNRLSMIPEGVEI
jgi:hypothetical protein